MFSAALYAHARTTSTIAHETSGAARIRHSLRPLIFRRSRNLLANLGRFASRECFPLSSSATGSAEWPPDDRLRRTIQYSRDVDDRTEKPRRTGSPHPRGLTAVSA